jgi:hypothetical protein
MPADKSLQIIKLCESWIKTVYREDGSYVINEDANKCRLRNNGIDFRDLNFNESRAACIGLTQVLIHKRYTVYIDDDHFLFWAWMGDILLARINTYFDEYDPNIKELFAATIRIATVPSTLGYLHALQEKGLTTYSLDSLKHCVTGSSLYAHTYLSFPLLEAVIKKKCCDFLEKDGRVKKEFKVPNKEGGRDIGYAPADKKSKNKCSSIRDMLFLLYEYVSDKELKVDIDQIRGKLVSLESEKDGFDVIGKWRNTSLHGQGVLNAVGGTLLNIAVLITLHDQKDSYEKYRSYALKSTKFNEPHIGIRPPWIFYPPY